MKSPADWEYDVLTSTSAQDLLSKLSETGNAPQLSVIEKLRKQFGREMTESAIRINTSRQKALGKFSQSAELWLDVVRVEQATHQQVSIHKSQRFQNKMVADLCCGVGGDSLSLAKTASALIALDKDYDTLRRLEYNLKVTSARPPYQMVMADANRFCFGSELYLHVDPDRRAADRSGRPQFQIDAYQPGPETLLKLMSRQPGGCIKLSPGSNYEKLQDQAEKLGIKTEVEVVSLHGECREATFWFGSLAGPKRRSATMLPSGYHFQGMGGTHFAQELQHVKPESVIVELDPALIRAELAKEYAGQYGLQPVVLDYAFLLRPNVLNRNSVSNFAEFNVVSVTSADRRSILQMLQKLGWQNVVVKTRGRLSAAEVQGWIKARPTGKSTETLLVWTFSGQKSVAIAAHRKTDKN